MDVVESESLGGTVSAKCQPHPSKGCKSTPSEENKRFRIPLPYTQNTWGLFPRRKDAVAFLFNHRGHQTTLAFLFLSQRGATGSRLSQWSEWTICSRKCELGTTERSRQIVKEGSGGLGAGLALKEVRDLTESFFLGGSGKR